MPEQPSRSPDHVNPATVGGEVRPRWEWRSFAFPVSLWPPGLRTSIQQAPTELSSESYFLTPHSPRNVKLRGGRIEVKELLERSEAGLELWRPIRKYDFPMPATQLDEFCELLAVEPVARRSPAASPEAFLTLVARDMPAIRIVPVRKWRQRFTLNDCAGEQVKLLLEGTLLEGVALEHVDPARLLATLQAHRCDVSLNTSYVRAIKTVLGWAGS